MNFKKLLFMLALFPLGSRADVDLKNGSFNDSLVDISSTEENSAMERFYDSRATEEGWLGFGWGSIYQTRLIISKEGSLRILENGLESESYFVLSNLSLGTYSFQDQIIKKTPAGYRRELPSGRFDYFSTTGRLERILLKKSLRVLNYDSKNRPVSITVNGQKKLHLEWYPDGKIKSVSNFAKKKSSYFYDDISNMIKSIDESGNIYLYEYDINHNLIKMVYPDQKNISLKYNKNSFVTELVDKNGEITRYGYESNPENPKYHYWTNVLKINNAPTLISRNEYEIKMTKNGNPYTYREAITKNGVTTDTVFSECCALPVKISKGSEVVNHYYNDKSQLIKKEFSNGTFIDLEYDNKINKIVKATYPGGWTTFAYNKKKKLLSAAGNKAESVELIYDSTGKFIKAINYKKSINSTKQKMNLFYDNKEQVVKIELENVGTADISYKENGEVVITMTSKSSNENDTKEIKALFESFLSLLSPVTKL